MTTSSKQASEFYSQVAREQKLWTIKDKTGFPAPKNSEGKRATPFWSSRELVEKVIQTIPAYKGFTPHELSWEEFVSKWVPGMTKDGLLAGLNWSGERVTGYDIKPTDVQKNVEASM